MGVNTVTEVNASVYVGHVVFVQHSTVPLEKRDSAAAANFAEILINRGNHRIHTFARGISIFRVN